MHYAVSFESESETVFVYSLTLLFSAYGKSLILLMSLSYLFCSSCLVPRWKT